MPINVTTSLTGALANNVSQGSVTFTFADNYEVGNYVDGPAYVVVPSGTATINSITPAQTTLGGLVVNGAGKNFAYGDAGQPFDGRGPTAVPYSGAKSFTTGTVTAGDVIIKAVSNTTAAIVAGDGATTRGGLCDEWATLFVVSSAPAANSFSPAATGWPGRGTPTSYVVDVPAFVSALPSYNTTGQTVMPYSEIMDHIDRYAPVGIWTSNVGYQEMLPRGMGDPNFGTTGTNYGERLNLWMNPACMALISDGYTTEQKETIATRLISNGIQWYDVLANVTPPANNGGHYQWFQGACACAVQATGRSFTTFVADVGINWAQAFQFEAADIAKLTVHSNASEPHTWRRRDVKAVSGTVVTVECTQSTTLDPSHVQFATLILTRESDGATANVISSNSLLGASTTLIGSNTTTNVELTIDAQPTPAFQTNDVVYFQSPFSISTGDYEWGIAGKTRFNAYNPAPLAHYRWANWWGGQVYLIKAAGWSGDFNDVFGYVKRANNSNDPAGFDFQSHNQTTWESEFWTQHGATIFP